MHHVLERLVMTCPDLLTLKVQEVNRAHHVQDHNELYSLSYAAGSAKDSSGFTCLRFQKTMAPGSGKEVYTRGAKIPYKDILQAPSRCATARAKADADLQRYNIAEDTNIHVEDLRVTQVQSSPTSETNNSSNSNNNSNNDHSADDMYDDIPSSSDASETLDSPPVPSSPMSLSDSATASGSLPVAWACKNLRTLELRLALRQGFTLGLFVDHFMMYCPRITRLHLVMFELNMGQSVGNPGESGYYKIEPDVRLLVGLVHLEEITLSVRHIRGTFDIAGMEFMRPHSSRDMETTEQDDLHIVWPQLVAFNVRYSFPKELDCSEFEKGLQALRPGVEFRIRKPFFT
ncbi:hypothetical protein BGX26_000555 [Mortierella sp. AD094]|nr:hypothetical protein BGX26_000555 [Mortierella sp. AD094]